MRYELRKEEDFSVSKWMGGKTKELAIFPPDSKYIDRDFIWRLSSATVELEESDFSKLPDYDRVVMVMEGSAVLTYDGKKSISYDIFYNALEIVKTKMSNEEKDSLTIWKEALDKITPQVEVKSRRIGGATFQVPTEIRPDRKESISMKNMILYARKRGGKTMADKLAAEIMDAYNDQGGAFKRKEDMHRMAEANRAFAHFRF